MAPSAGGAIKQKHRLSDALICPFSPGPAPVARTPKTAAMAVSGNGKQAYLRFLPCACPSLGGCFCGLFTSGRKAEIWLIGINQMLRRSRQNSMFRWYKRNENIVTSCLGSVRGMPPKHGWLQWLGCLFLSSCIGVSCSARSTERVEGSIPGRHRTPGDSPHLSMGPSSSSGG